MATCKISNVSQSASLAITQFSSVTSAVTRKEGINTKRWDLDALWIFVTMF